MGYEYTLYFIQESISKNIKIGISKRSLPVRRKELQTGNSDNLKIIAQIEAVPFSFEAHVHGICQDFQVLGEWFKPNCLDHLLKHPFYKENIIKVKT
jgi:hypothetical protein